LIENLSKKKYTAKKKVKPVLADNATSKNQKTNDKKAKMKYLSFFKYTLYNIYIHSTLITYRSSAVTMLKNVLTDGKENMQQVLYNSAASGHSGLTASILQFDDSKFPPPPSVPNKVSLWDATTGSILILSVSNLFPVRKMFYVGKSNRITAY
jgi:hypothetical protein